MKQVKRTIKSVEKEIREIESHYGKRGLFATIFKTNELIEARYHIEWLRGYLQALKDERGK